MQEPNMAANTGCSHNKLKDTKMQQKENMKFYIPNGGCPRLHDKIDTKTHEQMRPQ